MESKQEETDSHAQEQSQPMSPEAPDEPESPAAPEQDIEESQHAVNEFSTPLIGKEQKAEQLHHGHSFNSKRMAMGPAFFNIRIICDCVGRALRRHMDFSQGHWFLDELNDANKQKKGT